jgi:hypothetical protein
VQPAALDVHHRAARTVDPADQDLIHSPMARPARRSLRLCRVPVVSVGHPLMMPCGSSPTAAPSSRRRSRRVPRPGRRGPRRRDLTAARERPSPRPRHVTCSRP